MVERLALVLALLPVPALAESTPPALELARVCYLEASFRHTDCIAIWHVARKRAADELGIEVEDVEVRDAVAMLESYSAIRARNPRAAEVSTYPNGSVADKGPRWNAEWLRLLVLAVELCQGMHPDPCPRARHWGGSMDAPHGAMIPARCAGATANTFYAVRRTRL